MSRRRSEKATIVLYKHGVVYGEVVWYMRDRAKKGLMLPKTGFCSPLREHGVMTPGTVAGGVRCGKGMSRGTRPRNPNPGCTPTQHIMFEETAGGMFGVTGELT